LDEWTDPLWVHYLRLAVLLLIFLGTLPTITYASIRHSVFGLNPHLTYDVYVGDTAVLTEACPSPSGDLTFLAPSANPVRVVPNRVPFSADMPVSPDRGLGVAPPMPNPTGGSFEMRMGAEWAGEVRVSLIEGATGRARYAERFFLSGGETQLCMKVPEHLASGLYLVRVESGAKAAARKLLLLRDGGRSLKR
jgi:hypothetical protein